jgi:hypothetical protein
MVIRPVAGCRNSVPGHSSRFGRVPTTSASTLQTDIVTERRDVSNVPITEVTDAIAEQFRKFCFAKVVDKNLSVRHRPGSPLRDVTIGFEEFPNPAKPDMAERCGETSVAQVFQSTRLEIFR